jgi:hypothetical protein
MTTTSLATALRTCSAGLYPLEAGVGLLTANGTFLHRDDFTSRFVVHGTTGTAAVDGDAATAALTAGELPCSGANTGSSGWQPASPEASPSISATPSPASASTTSSGW